MLFRSVFFEEIKRSCANLHGAIVQNSNKLEILVSDAWHIVLYLWVHFGDNLRLVARFSNLFSFDCFLELVLFQYVHGFHLPLFCLTVCMGSWHNHQRAILVSINFENFNTSMDLFVKLQYHHCTDSL